MNNIFRLYALILVLCIFSSCENDASNDALLRDEILAVKTEFAPDKRVALFNIEATKYNKSHLIKGESNLPEAVKTLKDKLTSKGITFIDSIQILPSAELEGKTFGLVTISVANLRSNPKHSAELATQALLGTPVIILKKKGSWSLVQTPDQYVSWVAG